MRQKTRLLTLLVLLAAVVTGAWAQTGMINGLFSVSATKRVYFSKGNLQYDGTNWKFAENQWEVLGANGTGATGTATNYPMDFFTWGNIDSPTYNGTTYYTENADLSGITDWGSRMGSGWYTLSKDEWLYLFGMESSNTDKSGHARYRKYFRATVNGVTGIVVLPDDLSGISDIPAESNRGTASNFAKTYTTDAWSAMESAGCVFLPTAGFRKTDASVSHVGWSGFYWESTAYDAGKAYTVGFDNTFVDPAGNFDRTFGFAVRLVIDQYYLTLADGTQDADKWTASTDGTNFGALPIGGLKGDGSETVTLQYNGRLKVKGVKATSDEKPAAPSVTEVTTFSELQTALSAGKDVKLMNDIVCTAEIEITSDVALTIDGNGKKLSTTSEIRAFKVGSSATVAFKDLTLTGFVSGGGPAINNSGTIVLDGCTISNCHVNNTNGGGAIENKSNGKLYAINTTFSGNYSGEIGGAINNYNSSLYMSGCTFTDNYTTKSNAYYGGAIGINRGSEVRLINCAFSGNKYGTNTGTNDIGVYSKPTNYTIAGCTGATIASDDGDITPNTSGTATLDYSDLSNISFTYNAE